MAISRRRIFENMALAGMAATAAQAAQEKKRPGQRRARRWATAELQIRSGIEKAGPDDGGSAKEATVEEFPVSTSIAGVSMRLKPGSIRELHWHSLAAEWAYVIDGRCRRR